VVEKTDRNVDRSKGQKLCLTRPAAQQQHDGLHTLLLFLIYFILFLTTFWDQLFQHLNKISRLVELWL